MENTVSTSVFSGNVFQPILFFLHERTLQKLPLVLITKLSMVFPEIYVVQYLLANKMLHSVCLILHSIKWLLMTLLFLKQCGNRLYFFKMVAYN